MQLGTREQSGLKVETGFPVRAQSIRALVGKYGLNMFWSNLSLGIQQLAAFLSAVVFARFASPELYGQYLFAMGLVAIAGVASMPGINVAVLRSAAQGFEGVYQAAVRLRLRWSAFGCLILFAIGAAVTRRKGGTVGLPLFGCALLLPWVLGLDSWSFFLKGRSRFKSLAVMTGIKVAVRLVLLSLAIILTQEAFIVIFAHCLVEAGFNLLYHSIVNRSVNNNKEDVAWKKQGYALTVLDLTWLAFTQADMVILASLMPMPDVAIYGVVKRIGEAVFSIVRATADALLPGIFRSSSVTLRRFLAPSLALCAVPLSFYFLLPPVIIGIFGSEYSRSIRLTQCYLFTTPIVFLAFIANGFLVKYKYNREINLSHFAAVVAALVLYFILIPKYGAWGGVIAGMTYYALQTVLSVLILAFKRRWPLQDGKAVEIT